MATFEVKTQSLAVRCEICHQADLFEPATGVCLRCRGVVPPPVLDTPAQPDRRSVHRFRYTGANVLTRMETFRNVLLGGVIGTLPGLVLPGFLLAVESSDVLMGRRDLRDGLGILGLVFAVCLGFSFIPGCISGFLTGKKLRSSQEFRSIKQFREFGGQVSFLSTVILILTAVFLSGLYQMFKFHLSPMDAFGGPFCTLLLPVTYFPLFNTVGGFLIGQFLKFLDRDRIEHLRD